MMDNRDLLIAKLHELNLSIDEARLYIELLREPHTHLRLSHLTGINRTKVYRLIEDLEKRSLVARRSDDRGTFLVARDPAALEIEIVNQEEESKRQRSILNSLMPSLDNLKTQDRSTFVIHAYEGVEGFKQMMWHELKTKDELLALGNVTLEQMVLNHRWADKHRAMGIAAGYRVREIINVPYVDAQFFKNKLYMEKAYTSRSISNEMLPIDTPVVIYNDTVATYQLNPERRVGVEIVSKAYATTMRHMFEHYWQLAAPAEYK